MNFTEHVHIIGGLAPNADAFTLTVRTDVFEVQGEGAWFLYWMGTNDDDAFSVVTVEACDDTTPTNSTAIPFMYRASTTFDTWGAWTQALAAGFSTARTSDNMYEIFVPASAFAALGRKYCRLAAVEGDDHPVDGVVVAGVVNPRYRVQPTSLID
jgi:hypothetical protein